MLKFRFFTILALLCTVVQGTWADEPTWTNVTTDSELRAAIQNDGANITVSADILLSNSTLSIAEGTTVTINLGGYIRAYGDEYGAGIGGGDDTRGGTLNVNGGRVEAYGGTDAAGIGGGEGGNGGIVNITGGYVYAEGNDLGAGIGGGQDGDGADVTITGDGVIAKAGRNEDGGLAIGRGDGNGAYGSLTLGDDRCVLITDNLWRSKKENRISDCKTATHVRIIECAHGEATASIVDGDKHDISNCKWCYMTGEEAHTFSDYGQCTVCGLIGLADNADNSGIISHWDKTANSVTLNGRTLYKDGDWNTLCLPFNLTSLTGTPLADATVKELDTEGTYDTDKKTSFDASDGTLYLYFKTADAIEAGKPYIIKWESGTDVENPVFSDVTISHVSNDVTSDDGKVSFIGNYDPVGFTVNDKSNFFVGVDNEGKSALFWPNGSNNDDGKYYVNAFRAYFHVDLGTNAGVRAFVLNFEDNETTGVALIDNGKLIIDNSAEANSSLFTLHSSLSGWYDLSGRKLSGKPTKKGVYIYNGKLVVIK